MRELWRSTFNSVRKIEMIVNDNDSFRDLKPVINFLVFVVNLYKQFILG